jgi:hypothetical protein
MNSPPFEEPIWGSKVQCQLDACWCRPSRVPYPLRPLATLPSHNSARGHRHGPTRSPVVAICPDAVPKLIV